MNESANYYQDRRVVKRRQVQLPTMQTYEVTTMQTAKQEALEAIQRLPDDADIEQMIYRLYVLENIRRGQQDVAEGETESAEGLLKDIQSW